MQPIETKRLLIREFEQSDFESYSRLVSDKAAVFWLPDLYASDIAEARVQFDTILLQQYLPERKMYFMCVSDKSGKFAGMLSLTVKADTPYGLIGSCGWVLAPDCRRMGYAKEAASAFINIAFEKLGFMRLSAECVSGNTAGNALCESLSFTHEATLKAYDWVGGALRDRNIYRLMKKES